MKPECLRTVVNDKRLSHVAIHTLNVLQVTTVEIHTRVTKQPVVEQPVFPVQSIQQCVSLQLLTGCVDDHFEVFPAPL